MLRKHVLKHAVACLAAAFVLCMGVFTSMYSPRALAFAAESTGEAFEKQNVFTDLQNSVIAGEKFNAADYPHNEAVDPQIISFVEFGYSYSPENQQDFGLYVYVYNPQDAAFDTRSGQSAIQFSYGKSANDKYPLVFLNYSNAAGYEGRFYKFKVNLSSARRREILRGVDQYARVYSVTGIELSVGGIKTDYACAQTYTYSGYSLGYGSDLATESTLSCAVEGFEKYVELDVHQTVYRPEGDYYEGQQSQLNSCYFRVPEKYFTDYGDLTKINMEWYEYLTKPILVTETNYLYQRLYELHGAPVKDFSPVTDFLIFSHGNTDASWLKDKGHGLGWVSDVEKFDDNYLFLGEDGLDTLYLDNLNSSGTRFDSFAAVFYAGRNKTYKDRFVSASELEEQFLLNSELLGGPYFGGLFSQALFTDYVNDGHLRGLNKKTVHKDDLVDTWWNITTKDGWQTLFGGYDVETIYDSMKAIVTSEDEDFDVGGSDADVAERLKIGEADVADFKAEYEKAKVLGERLVLLRYGESTYYSVPCAESYRSSSTERIDMELVHDCLRKLGSDDTAYMAQETVYLDFDIISLWFKAEDGVETEIPVVMSPQNVISGLNPPNEENYHNDGPKIVKIILIVLLVIVALIIVYLAASGMNKGASMMKPKNNKRE